MSMNEHEEKFIRAFAASHKRDRYLNLLGSKKRRRKFLDCLYHGFEFDKRYSTLYNSASEKSMSIVMKLKSLGAPDECHVICMASDFDGKTLRLEVALDDAIYYSAGAGVLSCIPGKLAYYVSEDAGERYIFSR